MQYYTVAPTQVIRHDADRFTYHSQQPLQPGQLVVVEVGSRQVPAVVLGPTTAPSFATKPITQILQQPALPQPLLATAQWLSQYYATHLATVWQTMLPRGLLKKRRQQPANHLVFSANRTKNVLTADQRQAIDRINQIPSGTALLHGVTGAGKTLVYSQLAEQAWRRGLSSLVLVPEIALTSQLVAQLQQQFPRVIVSHSRQTEAQRHLIWQQVLASDQPQIIVGPRSALFLPVRRLGMIVIDECHEPSFKQEQSPRYSALRTAAILARQHQAKLVLGSATPTVTDYFLAQHTAQPIITMPRPARSDTVRPDITMVDMTQRQQFVRHHFLSDPLLQALEQTFAAGQQALLFHNRRGTASVTLCHNCGWQAACPRCFIPLTLHADHHQLICHLCGHHQSVPTSCPDCQAVEIFHKGLGTKRLESELRQLFPRQTIARFDGDTAADAGLDKRYHQLATGQIDLIIGTQAVAKGLDLPGLRCVGVVQADAGLALPDFVAPERTFQLLAQVIGRVGRSNHPTRVVVQSYQPTHPAIVDGLAQDYTNFYQRTIAERRQTAFPPFVYLLKLTCQYKTEASAVSNAQRLAQTLRNTAPPAVEILGPTPAFYERQRDQYRWQLLLKSPRRQWLVDLLAQLPSGHWQYELDPTSLL